VTSRATTAARAGAVFAVTLVVLQILQQVVGAFNPRASVSALIALTAATATFALDRLRQGRQGVQERNAALDAALRFWPLRRLGEVDRRRLGVFPAKLEHGEPADRLYLPGELDEQIREAVKPGRFVLVLGPPRAGKSRAALEAARMALGDEAWLIVPRDAAGLRAVADAYPPPGAELEEDTLLWLDGLDRYVEALDAGVLDRILTYDPPPAVVATMRSAEYDELIAGTGEVARAIAARAHVLELPDDGTGRERAASGRGEPVALAPLKPSDAPRDASGNAGDRLVLATGAVAVAGLVATVAVSLGGGFSEPTLSARLDSIRRDATRDRRSTEMTRTADFHGTGDKSYLFLFSDRQSLPEPGRAPRPRTSDELRIYDRSGNGLKLRFRFQPDRPGLVYQHRFLGDIDGDGEEELVGGWGVPGEASQALLPFMVDWDEGANRYRLTSLQPAPALPVATPSALGVAFVEAYNRRLDLRDGKQTLSGYRVQDFAIVKPSRLVTGVVVKPMTPTLTGTVELKPSILRIAGAGPELIPCHVQGVDAPRVLWHPGRLLANVISDRWPAVSKSRPCVP
jgi:hypothetical protein